MFCGPAKAAAEAAPLDPRGLDPDLLEIEPLLEETPNPTRGDIVPIKIDAPFERSIDPLERPPAFDDDVWLFEEPDAPRFKSLEIIHAILCIVFAILLVK